MLCRLHAQPNALNVDVVCRHHAWPIAVVVKCRLCAWHAAEAVAVISSLMLSL